MTYIALAVVVVFSIVAFLTRNALKSAEKKSGVVGAIFKIVLNYLQVMALASRFSLDWPLSLQRFFTFPELAGNSGEQFLSLDCLMSDAFFKKMVAGAVLPPLLVLINALVWTVAKLLFLLLRKELSLQVGKPASFQLIYLIY